MPFYSLSSSGGSAGNSVVEAASVSAFPVTGAANTIYVARDTNVLYRWNSTAYVVVASAKDEVIEGATLSAFPATGETGNLYIALDTGKAYRWTTGGYVEVSAAPVTSVAGRTGAISLTSSDVGLGNVNNTSDASKPVSTAQAAADSAVASSASTDATTKADAAKAYAIQRANHTGTQAISTVSGLQTALDSKQGSGSYATLDGGGKVPATLLPSYVDDVIEAASLSYLNANVTGETGKIYVTLDNNKTFRWSGSAYVEISASPGSTDAVTEGSVNLYFTNSRASAAAPVQSVAGRTGTVTLTKTDVGLDNVTNVDATARANHTGTQSVSTITGLASVATSGSASDLSTGTLPAARIPATAVTAGSYGSPNQVATITVGADGRLTGASNTTLQILASQIFGGTLDIGRIPTGTTSTTVCLGTDSRLSDARTPLSHAHGNISSAGLVNGNTSSGQIVVTTTGGALTTAATISTAQVSGLGSLATQSSVAYSSLTGIPSSFAPSAHTHGAVTNDGKIGTTSGLLVVTTTGGALTTAGAITGNQVQVYSDGEYQTLSDDSDAARFLFQLAGSGLETAVENLGGIGSQYINGLATVATSGSYNDLSDKPTIPSAYTLPTASSSVTGGVKIGSGITITGGVISVSTAYAASSHKTQHATGGSDALTPADIGAAALPSEGLSITKSGDWAPQSPTQFFNLVPAQAVQFGSTYTRYSGKWIASWAYTEAAWITGQTRITSLTFDNLEGVTGNYAPTSMSAITTLSLPNLSYVGGNYAPSSMSALTTLSTPNLSYVGGNFNPQTMAALTSLSAPNLSYVGGQLALSNCGALTTISLPALNFIGNSTGVSITLSTGMTSLTTLSLPALATISTGSVNISAPALANFTLPTNGTFKNGGLGIFITSAVLTQTSVDNILQAYASLDGTNGTTAFAFLCTVTGSSAAPSNAGSTTTAGSNFVCSGTTCTVNWTAHGYTTGDVLRISGITTATNANKYALITVVNANQFTYAITSQTATGAGTATVVKAGASVKALVTRGVTLTTN